MSTNENTHAYDILSGLRAGDKSATQPSIRTGSGSWKPDSGI